MYDFVIKSKQIYVPPSKGRKGYFREDPREKHVLEFLKSLLKKIFIAKKKDGFLTNEQRKYIRRSLKEIEPRMKYLKTKKQRLAVAKVLREIGEELKGSEKPKKVKLTPEQKVKAKKEVVHKEVKGMLGELDKKTKSAIYEKKQLKKVEPSVPKGLTNEEYRGLRKLGYSDNAIRKMSIHEAKTVYWS